MGRLTNSKKIKLLKIQKARMILDKELEIGLITEQEISDLFRKNLDFGLNRYNRKYSYKESILKDIFNNPFILCDLKNISEQFKVILPLFLNAKYQVEKDQIESLYNEGYITKDEYYTELDELEFCYYKSSDYGKAIVKTGQLLDIKDNALKKR